MFIYIYINYCQRVKISSSNNNTKRVIYLEVTSRSLTAETHTIRCNLLFKKTNRCKGDTRTIDQGTLDLGQAHVKSSGVELVNQDTPIPLNSCLLKMFKFFGLNHKEHNVLRIFAIIEKRYIFTKGCYITCTFVICLTRQSLLYCKYVTRFD